MNGFKIPPPLGIKLASYLKYYDRFKHEPRVTSSTSRVVRASIMSRSGVDGLGSITRDDGILYVFTQVVVLLIFESALGFTNDNVFVYNEFYKMGANVLCRQHCTYILK